MKTFVVCLAAVLSLPVSNAWGRDQRIELVARLSASGSSSSGKAKFEQRSDREKFSVEIEDGPDGTTVEIVAGGASFLLVLDAVGFGDLNLDSRQGDGVPAVSVGDEVVVVTPDQLILSGVLRQKGDTNGDAKMDISDAISLLLWLFLDSSHSIDLVASDGNDDDALDISDVLWILVTAFGDEEGTQPAEGTDDDQGECEIRNRFVTDVDGDGRREDGHVRARRREQGNDVEVEVGPLEVDSVTILISDDGDPANAYFSGAAPVLANGDAELELEDGLPQSLADMAGDRVFVQVGDAAPVFLQTVPDCAGPADDRPADDNPDAPGDPGEGNTGGPECEIRNRFVTDVDGDGRREDGHVRARRREQGNDVEVEVGPLEVDSVTILISDDGDPANAYFSGAAPVLANGDAELELEDGLPQSLADMAGDRVFVQVGDATPVFLQTVPDCAGPADDSPAADNPNAPGKAGNGDAGGDECEIRNRFDADVDGDGRREDGHVRARRREQGDDIEVEVGPLEVDSVTILISDDADPANAYFSGIAPVFPGGDAELELEDGLPQGLADMAGDHVFVRLGDDASFFLALVPDCSSSGPGPGSESDPDDDADNGNDGNDGDDGDDGDDNSGPGDAGNRDDAGDCEIRERFDLDVDGDGKREDGHIRVRNRDQGTDLDLEVEVGPLEVERVMILVSDSDDPAAAYFSREVRVRDDGDAELELENGLPQSLADMGGDRVFVVVDDVPVLLGAVPSGCAR